MRGSAVAAVTCGRTKSRWVSVSRSVPVEKFDLDAQHGAANGGGTSHRPTPGEAEQRPSGDTITPFGAVFRSHEPLPEERVLSGANGQLTGPAGARQVTRRAPEDRAETICQRHRQKPESPYGRCQPRCGEPVNERGLADRTGEPGVRRGELDDVHARERRAPREHPARIDVVVLGRPADDGTVVLELAREGKLLAGLPGRAAPLAVVEHDRGEPLTADPLRERGEPAGLDGTDAVGHHHCRVRPRPLGQVQPGLQLVTGSGGDPYGCAERGGGERGDQGCFSRYLTVFRYAIRSARCLASATPEKGMTLPGTSFCESLRKASRFLSSQAMPAFFSAR